MELLEQPDMSLAVAEQLLTGVKSEAASAGVALSVSVVDRGGNPVASCRMDGAQLGSASLAADKAFTAASFGFPTAAWSTSSAPGGSDWGLAHALGGRCVVFPGGVPRLLGRRPDRGARRQRGTVRGRRIVCAEVRRPRRFHHHQAMTTTCAKPGRG